MFGDNRLSVRAVAIIKNFNVSRVGVKIHRKDEAVLAGSYPETAGPLAGKRFQIHSNRITAEPLDSL